MKDSSNTKDKSHDRADRIYASSLQEVPDFVFDEAVVEVFADMINRSVPGYASVVAVCGVLAERYSQPDTALYDLGCSLGATSLSMAQAAASGCHVVAIDNSKAMIQQLEKKIIELPALEIPIHTRLADIQSTAIESASMIAMNFTLQFLPVGERAEVLTKIYDGLRSSGVFVLSEKIRFEDSDLNALFSDLHHNFKRNNGYSDLEISQKRDAIEDVLVPETLDAHRQRLLAAGFRRVETWFQCFNFVSLVAFK